MSKAIRYVIIVLCITIFFLLSGCRKKGTKKQSSDASIGMKKAAPNNSVTEELTVDQLILKLIGPDGKLIAGAKVGTEYKTIIRPWGTKAFWSLGRKRVSSSAITTLSDSQGIVRLSPSELISVSDNSARIPIYIWEDQKHLAAITSISLEESGQFKTVILERACCVHGAVQSKELLEIGQHLHNIRTYLSWQGTYLLMSDVVSKAENSFKFFVPAGVYRLQCSSTSIMGAQANSPSQTIVVPPNQPEMDIGVTDLQVTKVSRLIGKLAPELRNIKEWKNGEPVKLSNLQGKIVILDFWSHWCGRCVYEMPKLMELHDKFVDKGVVIIAIHDDSVTSIEEMYQKLQKAKTKMWGGRELPFLVALDSKEMFVGGTRNNIGGNTFAAYGISAWPTVVVIGRNGKVVRLINIAHSAPLMLIVQRMLGEIPSGLKTWLTSECEACDMERYYESLSANQ